MGTTNLTPGTWGYQKALTATGTINLVELLEARMGPDYAVYYREHGDDFVVISHTNAYLQPRSSIPRLALINIIAMSGGPDDEYKKLRAFFWNDLPTDDLPSGNRPIGETFSSQADCRFHDFHEVTLFHTPQLRCRFCDIKQTDTIKDTK